jgi:hypothetical protein
LNRVPQPNEALAWRFPFCGSINQQRRTVANASFAGAFTHASNRIVNFNPRAMITRRDHEVWSNPLAGRWEQFDAD